jgi:hypothetical protein
MQKPKISLLVPSRERLNLKLTLISSLISSCDDINNIELVFGTDEDDPKKEIIERICNNTSFARSITIKNNGKFIGINRIWNTLFEQTESDIVGYIGDDMAFMTPGWDTEIIKEFTGDNLPQDKLKLVHCYDRYRQRDEICVNAFTTRKYYDIVGYFTRPEFLINWSDQWMYQSYKAFNRIKYRRDIHIQHNHWVLGFRQSDNVATRMHSDLSTTDLNVKGNIEKYSNEQWTTLRQEHKNEIIKIGEYLNQAPNWSVVDP